MLLGLDAIDQLGGAIITKGQVKFGNQYVTKMVRGANSNDTIQPTKLRLCQIEDEDFWAHFDGEKWTEWWWTAGLPVLRNWIGCYESTLRGEIRAEFEKEVERWIDKGIVILWSGKIEGILPVLAVVHPTKKKVMPVLDFILKQVCGLPHQRWNRCMWRSHEGMEENEACNQDHRLKVVLPSNSCRLETMAVSIGRV